MTGSRTDRKAWATAAVHRAYPLAALPGNATAWQYRVARPRIAREAAREVAAADAGEYREARR